MQTKHSSNRRQALEQGFDTKLIHAGELVPRVHGAVTLPVFQSATFELEDDQPVRYIRQGNTPNHTVLGNKLAALEGAEACHVTGSGMAAISTSLLTILSTGDHLLAQWGLYGGTHELLSRSFPKLGIAVEWIDANCPETWAAKLRPTTKLIYVESMSSPLFRVGDLLAVAAFARANGLVSIIDNTFASPLNFRPAESCFDLSIHSGTKYLNGHDDIAAGAVIGRREWVTKIAHRMSHFGGALDPHAAFLLHRGLKTLGVRVRYQNESALKIAEFLESQSEIERVNYPGLQSHPDHARARDLFLGFGGTLSFEVVGGAASAERLMRRLTLPVAAPSLGGVDSLVMRPAAVSHAGLTGAERAALGIRDGLVRLAVGLETTEDLILDLAQALADG